MSRSRNLRVAETTYRICHAELDKLEALLNPMSAT
jgi:hypothetical protein